MLPGSCSGSLKCLMLLAFKAGIEGCRNMLIYGEKSFEDQKIPYLGKSRIISSKTIVL